MCCHSDSTMSIEYIRTQQQTGWLCSRRVRVLFPVVIAVGLFLVCSFYRNTSIADMQKIISYVESVSGVGRKNQQISPETSLPSSIRSPPIILLWTAAYSQTGIWIPQLSSLGCPISDCVITNDRQLFRESAAVLFHLRSVNLKDLPFRHDHKQRWVLLNGEAPPQTPKPVLSKLSGKINWTATYRKDSDIYAPYGFIVPRRVPVSVTTPPLGRKPVCWLVSHCQTQSRREKFVEELRNYISVDVYGKCGNLKCPSENNLDCYRLLSKKYKFYLSFENSICKDYVTEKLFNALSTDMVPVVMGGENYSSLLPPNSYVDALSFKSPKQLAHYLWVLVNDSDKYLSYFAWKKNYTVQKKNYQWACELCRKLHHNDTKVYNDLSTWWFQPASCSSWSKTRKSFLQTLINFLK